VFDGEHEAQAAKRVRRSSLTVSRRSVAVDAPRSGMLVTLLLRHYLLAAPAELSPTLFSGRSL
jgi:hypothetical protein